MPSMPVAFFIPIVAVVRAVPVMVLGGVMLSGSRLRGEKVVMRTFV